VTGLKVAIVTGLKVAENLMQLNNNQINKIK